MFGKIKKIDKSLVFFAVLIGVCLIILSLTANYIQASGLEVQISAEVPPPPPPPSLPSPGVSPPFPVTETKVILEGRAHPLSSVTILQNGRVAAITTADTQANFRAEITDITPGIWTFGVWAEDERGRRSIVHSFTTSIRVDMITTIRGIFLPPTIDLVRTRLQRGEILNILGMTTPQSDVTLFINSSGPIIRKTEAGDDGIWFYNFNTALLEDGSHAVRAKAVSPEGLLSSFSHSLAFNIGEGAVDGVCPGADLNKDDRVDLIDFSILLFWWGRDNPCADQNMDGNVNLPDFSIMLYWWTG